MAIECSGAEVVDGIKCTSIEMCHSFIRVHTTLPTNGHLT